MKSSSRINCASLSDIPSVTEIRNLLRPDHKVALYFTKCKDLDKKRIVEQLSEKLPECSVSYSGSDHATEWITVMPVVETSQLILRSNEITNAIDAYIETCVFLQNRYADGTLSPDWSSDEHGEHCLFENSLTGQIVEAPFAYPILPEHIDPYFFAQFVKSTPSCATVASLITDSFHDGARILEFILPKSADYRADS